MSLSDNYLRDLARRIAEATETPLGDFIRKSEDREQIRQRYEELSMDLSFSEASLQARTEWIWGWLVAVYEAKDESELRELLK